MGSSDSLVVSSEIDSKKGLSASVVKCSAVIATWSGLLHFEISFASLFNLRGIGLASLLLSLTLLTPLRGVAYSGCVIENGAGVEF